MHELPTRKQIKIGMKVLVELKEHQGTNKLTEGIVKNILTSNNFHPHGIKVELEDGQVGRVKKLFSNIEDVITTREYERDDPGNNTYEAGVEIIINEELPLHKSSNIDTSIPKDEDTWNEFKSTFQYDLDEENMRRNGKIEAADARKSNQKKLRDEIQKEVSLTVAAFANQDGGRLFIGINNDSSVLGLGRDLKEYGDSVDKFILAITDSLKKFLKNSAFVAKLKFNFANNGDKQYLVIQVPKSNEPIFVNASTGQEAYVRIQKSSDKFSYEDFLKHCKDRF